MVVAEKIKRKPFTYAPITLIDGEQGGGKSVTAVTRVVDPTFANMTSVKLADGSIVKAEPVLNKNGYAVIGYGKLWLPNQQPKIVKIPPKSCVIADDIKVIYNGHLYGIRYKHMELPDIVLHLNDGTIRDCYLIVDEAYIAGDKRDSLNPLVRIISKLSYQIRKRHIHLIFCAPDTNVLDFRLRDVETEHISCSYDERTKRVTMYIRNRKKYKGIREITYDASQYFIYYDTDENYEIPEIQLARAMAMAT